MNDQHTIIFPLGYNCDCATFLRNKGLRRYALPFDWLTGATIQTRINLLKNKFEGFLEKENLQPIATTQNSPRKGTKHYLDTNTGFKFFHDFSLNKTLDEDFPSIKQKYDKRIKRFYDLVEQSDTIAFIWCSSNKPLTNEEITNAKDQLTALFPNRNVLFHEIKNEEDLDNLNLSKSAKHHLKTKLLRLAVNFLSSFYFSKKKRRNARRKWERKFSLD